MSANGELLVTAKLRAAKKRRKEKRGDPVAAINARAEKLGLRGRFHPTKGWRG